MYRACHVWPIYPLVDFILPGTRIAIPRFYGYKAAGNMLLGTIFSLGTISYLVQDMLLKFMEWVSSLIFFKVEHDKKT